MDIENSIFQSLEIIEKRINEKLTVENIAADVYISKFHYMRLFREIVGDSVMDYIIKRKLTLAAKALLDTSSSILEIALDFGYDSREGFSRSFKAFMGKTPAEYRKHGLVPEITKSSKEYRSMEITKTTDAVIREINEWITRAKDLAKEINFANRQAPNIFWNGVAEQTEALANNFIDVLEQAGNMARKPDQIADGMDIVKAIDDTAFVAHSIAFQIELMEARTAEKNAGISFAGKYRELAWFCVEKAEKITVFFRELLLFVIEDMRRTAGEKIRVATDKGVAVSEIISDDYKYIKDEITQLVNELSETPVEAITSLLLDDSTFKAKLITITAKLNIEVSNEVLFEKMLVFSDALYDAAIFCSTIVKPFDDSSPVLKKTKIMQDIIFMGNTLFFYAKGELEYLVNTLDKTIYSDNFVAFEEIKIKINDYIKIAIKIEREINDISAFHVIVDKLHVIIADLEREADLLEIRGRALKMIAEEHKRLVCKIVQYLEELEEK